MSERDITPALGTHGQPGAWRRAREGARVALQRERWEDARWSYLFKDDTSYAAARADMRSIADVNRRMRGGDLGPVSGPVINAPVWTWEVPLYFWLGGIATGSWFVSVACELAGDHRSAVIARRVALGAVAPSPALLIADLGRPERFLNMLRIFKPRSPMNVGAWSLVVFSGLATLAVGADVLGRPRLARRVGTANVLVGSYLGSYTGVLLATTAVPLWARSRLYLGPIFVCTAAATGAAATRLALVGAGMPIGHPTRAALGNIETGAMAGELLLSSINERRLGRAGLSLEHGTPGRLFHAAKWGVRVGLGLRLLRRPLGPRAHHVASCCYLGAGLAFRYAWVTAGRISARDDEAVARMARGAVTTDDVLFGKARRRLASSTRAPHGAGVAAARYAELIRRASLLTERVLGRSGAVPGRVGTGAPSRR